MDFAVSRAALDGDIQVIVLRGQLDAHTYQSLKAELLKLIEDGIVKVVLDCHELEYISSAGLGVIKQMCKEFRNREGDLRLSKIPEKINRVLTLLGFSKIIQSFATNDDAVASYK